MVLWVYLQVLIIIKKYLYTVKYNLYQETNLDHIKSRDTNFDLVIIRLIY